MEFVISDFHSSVAKSANLNQRRPSIMNAMENACMQIIHARVFVRRTILCNVQKYALLRIVMNGGDAMASVSAHQYPVRAIAAVSNQNCAEMNVSLRRRPLIAMASVNACLSHVKENVNLKRCQPYVEIGALGKRRYMKIMFKVA